MRRLAILLLFCALTGCQSGYSVVPQPIVLCKGLGDGMEWRREFIAKPPHHLCAVVVVHGQDCNGVWKLYADDPDLRIPVKTYAKILKAVYPDRDVVLICCNPGGAKLGVPGVWYAKRFVWSRPCPDGRCVGKAEEFIQDKP